MICTWCYYLQFSLIISFRRYLTSTSVNGKFIQKLWIFSKLLNVKHVDSSCHTQHIIVFIVGNHLLWFKSILLWRCNMCHVTWHLTITGKLHNNYGTYIKSGDRCIIMSIRALILWRSRDSTKNNKAAWYVISHVKWCVTVLNCKVQTSHVHKIAPCTISIKDKNLRI